MKKSIVIAGFGGIGKTVLASKYKNVIDMESSPFKYDYTCVPREMYEKLKGDKSRKPNPDFPQNYIDAIKEAQKYYDYVLVWMDVRNMLDLYEKNGIDYVLIYPDEESVNACYLDRYIGRGNTLAFYESAIKWYYECLDAIKNNSHKKIVLTNSQTLEDYLLGIGAKLIPR